MRHGFFSALIAFAAMIMGATFATAQPSAQPVLEDFRPSSLNQPGREYPQVNSQGYARFRIEAPEAQSVSVSLGLGGQGGTVLSKAEDGSWMGTTAGPLDEGFHYYHLTVDGGTFNDPGALNFTAQCAGKAASKFPRMTRISTR